MSGRADASPERDELIRRFRAFAEREAGASPLYQALSAAVAEDGRVLVTHEGERYYLEVTRGDS